MKASMPIAFYIRPDGSLIADVAYDDVPPEALGPYSVTFDVPPEVENEVKRRKETPRIIAD